MPQLDIPLVRRPRHSSGDVSDEVIAQLKSMRAAIDLSQKVAGLDDKEMAAALEIDPGQWSRIKSGQANFPTDKYELFFDACGNEIPLRWLARRRGQGLHRLLSEVEEELIETKAERDAARAELATIKQFVRETRG